MLGGFVVESAQHTGASCFLNLSHYESLDPNVYRSDRQKCLKACGKTLPSHHPASILLLEPGECPLGLEPRPHVFDGAPARFLGLPDALRERRSYTTLASLLPQRFGIIALIRRTHFETFAGRPRLPICPLTASSNGTTCARSSLLAGVTQFAKGIPRPAVRLWMKIPLPFLPGAPRAPPPLPGGKSAIDGAILPRNHATYLGNPEHPCLHRSERAIRLPPLQPAMHGTLRRPWHPTRDLTPPTAGNQDIQQGIQYVPKRRMRHPTTAFGRCQGKDILEQPPR